MSEDDQDGKVAPKSKNRLKKRRTSTICLRNNNEKRVSHKKASMFLPKSKPEIHEDDILNEMNDLPSEIVDELSDDRTNNEAIPENNDDLSATEESQPLQVEETTSNENNVCQPTIEELSIEEVNNSHQSSSSPKKSKSKKKSPSKRSQSIDAATLFKDAMSEEMLYFALRGINPDAMDETEERNRRFDERFNLDDASNITGIIHLQGMNLIDHDIPLIVQRAFLSENKKCTGLILRNNGLTSNGVKMFVDALVSLKAKLKYLSLSSNPNVGDTGIEHLVRLIQENQWLSFLALPNTGMTNYGVKLLADALSYRSTNLCINRLTKLYMSNNKGITDDSFEDLTQIIQKSKSLSIFAIEQCSFSEEVRRRLKLIVPANKKRTLLLLI